jgi:hypothetical protein
MPLVVVAVITKSAGDQKDSYLFELKFQMGDNTLFSQTAETNFEKSDRVRSINFVQGLPIPEPGALRIALLHANKVAADYTIDFRCTQASPSPSETKLGKRKPNKRHATQKKARVRLAKA